MPGDSFYDLPKTHWWCARCKTMKPKKDFYRNKAGSCCRVCRKRLNHFMWKLYGKKWTHNSREKKKGQEA